MASRGDKHGVPVGGDSGGTAGAAPATGGDAGVDELLDGLERIVKELESGDLPLERALERFEQGVRLARRGSAALDAIEERVEMLLAERDQVVPLPTGSEEDEER